MAGLTRASWTLSAQETTALLCASHAFSKSYMSNFDPSHDYLHITRVVTLSRRLLAAHPLSATLDPTLILLTALLHDVGDAKYASSSADPKPVESFLLAHACPAALAATVQLLVSHVSYSHEIKNPASVAEVLEAYPELGCVQDADRLDALGAVGIGRCLVFSGVKRPQEGIDGAVEHFGEKLVRLEGLMKTEEGRRLARERTERIRAFEEWWGMEVVEGGDGRIEESWAV